MKRVVTLVGTDSVLEEEIAGEGGAVESGPWRIAYIKERARA